MELAKINRPTVDRLDRATVVIAPFAAMEQHGLHLPFGTDMFVAEEICRRVDARLQGQLLILPVTWLGNSPHHMGFAGSLTAEPETFIAVAVQVVTSVASHGFRNILMLNTHGGNQALMGVALQKAQRLYPQAQIAAVTYWHLIGAEIQRIRDRPIGSMGHACELETSVMLAVHPEWVGPERPVETHWGNPSEYRLRDMFAGGAVARYFPFDAVSRTGGIGDPTTASADKGQRILNAITDKLADVCRRMREGTL